MATIASAQGSAYAGLAARPQPQQLSAYRPVLFNPFPPHPRATFLLSEEDAKVFFDTCENPPSPSAEMRSLAKEAAEWFR